MPAAETGHAVISLANRQRAGLVLVRAASADRADVFAAPAFFKPVKVGQWPAVDRVTDCPRFCVVPVQPFLFVHACRPLLRLV